MAQSEPAGDRGYALFAQAEVGALTTFRVPARARWLAELHVASALPALLAEPNIAACDARFVLGGGSNVLFRGDYDGVVLRVATRGIEQVSDSADAVRLRVAAGENWDRFVRWTLDQGYAGLENLILIPGTVGAAPIQNIGAYGVELAEFVVAVAAWDCSRGGSMRIEAKDCGFAYRDSRFKQEPDRFIVTALELELPRERELRLDYAGLREELKVVEIADPTHGDVARAVETLRRCKLPDPAVIGNAGSFFKNPVVTAGEAEKIRKDWPAIAAYPAGAGRIKLSAAGLIEACGFKGRREGEAGVSARHALVLVNYGGATGAEVWTLAEKIRAAVAARFGVTIEPEARLP